MLNSPVEFTSFDGNYVKRLSDGDSATESHFVEYFSDLLAIKLRRRLQSAQEVEDLRQEVFLRVLKNLRTGEGVKHPERFGAYVFAVCANVLLEYFRAKEKTAQWDALSFEPRHVGHSAEQILIHKQSKLQIRLTVAELAAKDQQILQAVFFEEEDKDAVCSRYGIKRDYLRVILHRAKNRMREILAASSASKNGKTETDG